MKISTPTMHSTSKARPAPATVFALGILGLAASLSLVQAQPAGAPAGPAPPGSASPFPPNTPPELIKPALPPSEADDPGAVFRELDVAERGYVTLDDTRNLLGFEEAFKAVNVKGTGRLTRAQFRKAWTIYKSRQ